MDKELYFEMLEKKDEEIGELKADIFLMKEEYESNLSSKQVQIYSLINQRDIYISKLKKIEKHFKKIEEVFK